MLDAHLTQQLEAYLVHIRESVELVASLGDDPKSRELETLLGEIAALSGKITLIRQDDDKRKPSFMIRRAGTDIGVRFAGIPMGHEFTSLVLALLQVGGHPLGDPGPDPTTCAGHQNATAIEPTGHQARPLSTRKASRVSPM